MWIRTIPARYGIAVLSVIAMLCLHWLLLPWVGPSHNVIFQLGAVIVTLATAGAGPAVLTAVLAHLGAALAFGGIASLGSLLQPQAMTTALLYGLLCAVLITLGAGHLRRARREREAHAHDLLMLELVTDCFFVLDPQWRFTHVNNPALRFFNMTAEQLLGRQLWQTFPASVGTPIEDLFRKVARTGTAAHAELLAPVANRWLDMRLVPTGNGIMAAFTDVTRRRLAQNEAEHNAQFLRLVADSVSVLIAYVDLERRYQFINRRYAEAFGFSAEAAVGHTHAQLCGAQAYESIREALDCAFAGRSVSDEMPLRVRDLGERYLLASYRPDLDDSGQVRGVVLALSDITERVKAEHALREADRRKDEFLATLAHELRNPLAPILNAVQLLGMPTPARAEARNIIDRQARHMARLVDDLLDVSRITLGRINLRRERTSVAVIVGHAVEANRPLVEAAGHTFHVALPDAPLYVDADVVRLTQALLNLLNNAAKYTPAGGRIGLTVTAQGGQVLIAVSDTGVGIPDAMLPRIFDMFAQVDHSLERTQGGLGIGLTLAGKLVGMHGGTLVAHSEGLGRGSRFEIRIPVAAQPLTGGAAAPLAPPPQPAATPTRRVLVVDDNVDAAESLSLLLQAEGHETELAHDGLAAVAATARFAPDIVLLDIGLPGLNGYEAAMRMRSQGSGRPTLVAVTGWGQQQDRVRAAQAGFDLHLTKPVDPDVIMELARNPHTPALRAYAL